MAQAQRVTWCRGSNERGRRFTVVIDETPQSITALRVAIERARRTDVPVDLVYVAGDALDAGDGGASAMRRLRDTYGPGQVMPQRGEEPRTIAERRAQRCVRRAFPKGVPEVPLRIIVRLRERDEIVVAPPSGRPSSIVGAARAGSKAARNLRETR
jgi:hypothetical protein